MNNEFKASEIDEKFDNGEDVSEYFDMDNPIIKGPQIEMAKNDAAHHQTKKILQSTDLRAKNFKA